MSDVNLIPGDYTRQLSIRKAMRRFIYGFGVLLLLVLAARISLEVAHNYEKSRAEKLKSGEVFLEEQKSQLDRLEEKKEDLQRRLGILEDLRGGPPAKQMFLLIDRAINESVWFTAINFSRAEENSDSSKKGKSTGYFIVMPKGEQEDDQDMPWQSGRIKITGRALTHSALADFVNLLADQPQIKTVQVDNTHSRKYLETSVVEYELSAVMIPDYQ